MSTVEPHPKQDCERKSRYFLHSSLGKYRSLGIFKEATADDDLPQLHHQLLLSLENGEKKSRLRTASTFFYHTLPPSLIDQSREASKH